MQPFALALEIVGAGLFPVQAEDAAGPRGHGFLPIGILHRVDLEILGDLLDGLDALERFKRYAGFELDVVSSSFCTNFAWFRLGSSPAPGHQNHSLAPGPIVGGRLNNDGGISKLRHSSGCFFDRLSNWWDSCWYPSGINGCNERKKLERCDVLIFDAIGYLQQSREAMEVFFTLLSSDVVVGCTRIDSQHHVADQRWCQLRTGQNSTENGFPEPGDDGFVHLVQGIAAHHRPYDVKA